MRKPSFRLYFLKKYRKLFGGFPQCPLFLLSSNPFLLGCSLRSLFYAANAATAQPPPSPPYCKEGLHLSLCLSLPSGKGENEKSQKPRFFVGFGKAGRRLFIFYTPTARVYFKFHSFVGEFPQSPYYAAIHSFSTNIIFSNIPHPLHP